LPRKEERLVEVGFKDVVCDIYSRHGIRGFYFGWTSTFYTAMNPAIQNTVFDQIRTLLLNDRQRLDLMESFTLGAFSKALATIATYPAVRAKTLIQNMIPENGSAPPNVFNSILDIFAKDGMLGLLRGIEPTLQKGVLQSAFMLMVREHVDHATRAFFGMARR